MCIRYKGLNLKKRKTSYNLTSHIRKLKKESKLNPKASRKKELIKMREVENRKRIENINETKGLFSEKMNKIDKPRKKEGKESIIKIIKTRN